MSATPRRRLLRAATAMTNTTTSATTKAGAGR
jgi:hypothetical protein